MFKVLLVVFFITLLPKLVSASEQDLYDFLWLDPDKQVYVLQNKIYQRKHTTFFDIGYIMNMSSDFQSTSGFSGKLGHYLTEDWGFEINYNQYSNSDNTTYKNIKSINGLEPFQRKIDRNISLLALWTPFYGKVNTFNRIIYFDWSFGLGPSFIEAQSNAITATSSNSNLFIEEKLTGAMAKTNLKFHVNKNWHINAEYQHTTYRARGPIAREGKTMRTNSDLIFSIGFSF
jgi:outer membrane beta-barrel protein